MAVRRYKINLVQLGLRLKVKAKLQNKLLGLFSIPLATALVTAFGVSLDRPVGSLSHIYLYLLIIIVAALWWGQLYGLYAVCFALLAIIYFFVPPRGSFELDTGQYRYTSETLGLIIFLVLAFFTIYLITAVNKARQQAQKLAELERASRQATEQAYYRLEMHQKQTVFLQRARQLLDDMTEPEVVLPQVLTELQELYGGNYGLTIQQPGGTLSSKSWQVGPSLEKSENLSQIEMQKEKEAKTRLNRYYLPLQTGGQQLGQLVYAFDGGLTLDKEKDATETLATLAQYIATALETSQLYRTLEFQNNEIAQLLRNNLRTDSTLNYRASQLSIFYRVLSAVISGLEQKDLMSLALSEAARVLKCSVGAVFLYEATSKTFEVVARRGSLQVELGTTFSLGANLASAVIQSGKPYLSNALSLEPQTEAETETKLSMPILGKSLEPIESCIYVPIQNETEKLGVIVVGSPQPNQYNPEEVDFLLGLANLLATAIFSQRFYEERERVAGMDERNRIARNLHDGLAQTINYIGLKTQLIKELYQAGEHAAVEGELERISRAAQMARRDVREALYGLLHTSRDRNLVLALTDLIRENAELNGLKIELKLPEGLTTTLPDFSLAMQSQLLRIVQEALANVQKHSRATEVIVELAISPEADQFCLAICDNGVGFKPSEAKKASHYGLEIMQERAKSLGAHFELQSQPGNGTTVRINLALNKLKTTYRSKEKIS